MAAGREILNQINSISSTRKITSAMEMVAASKMRRVQETMARGKPYSRHIRQVVGHIACGSAEYQHFYMRQRDPKRIGYIVVSTDRGLCGGLNINLFKTVISHMREWEERGIGSELFLIGAKADHFFARIGGEVLACVRDLGEKVQPQKLIGVVKVMLDKFENGELDRVYLVANEFLNTMTQRPAVSQLLPLEADEDDKFRHHWDYIYEPDDARVLLSGLLLRYIESLVYQAVVENGACEQAARMLAMKNATENAGELIDELKLVYNKERQAAITQELSEIVSGAAAV